MGLAEDFAQEALVAALEKWPLTGIPEKPGAWLMTTGKNRALDLFRRKQMLDRKHNELGREMDDRMEREWKQFGEEMDDQIGDDLLRLVFISCHPVLPAEGRVALTLRLLGGLTTQEIARAFLVPEPTIAQRIVRAKRTLSEAQVPFEVPRGAELAERLSSVLAVLYLIFNEGYPATSGDNWLRPGLCAGGLHHRLGWRIRKRQALAAAADDRAAHHHSGDLHDPVHHVQIRQVGLLILANVAMAPVGGLLALLITGTHMSVSSGIGFLALFGVAVQTGVIMLEYINQFRARGHPILDAAIEGAVAAAAHHDDHAGGHAGLLPAALSHDIGSDSQRPFAIVIVGGLIAALGLAFFCCRSSTSGSRASRTACRNRIRRKSRQETGKLKHAPATRARWGMLWLARKIACHRRW